MYQMTFSWCLFASGHALSLLARTVHCSAAAFGVAGTKDKRAVTVQQVTAFKVGAPAISPKFFNLNLPAVLTD